MAKPSCATEQEQVLSKTRFIADFEFGSCPGAATRKGGIGNDVALRGYQGENLTVLIVGARIYGACPNNIDPRAFHADFAEVDRVEVGKGPYDMKSNCRRAIKQLG